MFLRRIPRILLIVSPFHPAHDLRIARPLWCLFPQLLPVFLDVFLVGFSVAFSSVLFALFSSCRFCACLSAVLPWFSSSVVGFGSWFLVHPLEYISPAMLPVVVLFRLVLECLVVCFLPDCLPSLPFSVFCVHLGIAECHVPAALPPWRLLCALLAVVLACLVFFSRSSAVCWHR